MSQPQWNAPQKPGALPQSVSTEGYAPQPSYGAPQAFPPPQYHPGTYPLGYPPKPPNYRVLAIVSLLLGFVMCSVMSIVYSFKVDSEYKIGDIAAAQQASKRAKGWAIAAFVVSALYLVFLLAFAIWVGATWPADI